jgi:tetratricopeptide (TPR) repeat protein
MQMHKVADFSLFENNPRYFIRDIDVNGDGMADKIISSAKHEGDELYFFIKKETGYVNVLKSINFSQDGGHVIGDIKPSSQGNNILVIRTYFDGSGGDEAFYFISNSDHKWVLSKTVYRTSSWQEDPTKVFYCEVSQNLDLKSLVTDEGAGKIRQIPEENRRDKVCKVDYIFDEATVKEFNNRFKEENLNLVSDVERYKSMFSKYRLTKENVEDYNNLGYYLEQNEKYEEAVCILTEVVNRFPDRAVAWLNLGDAQWGRKQVSKAKENYLRYLSLIKSQVKDLKKVPERVHQRI